MYGRSTAAPHVRKLFCSKAAFTVRSIRPRKPKTRCHPERHPQDGRRISTDRRHRTHPSDAFRFIPAHHPHPLSHSRPPLFAPVPFPNSATVLLALPSARSVSFQNKAHISYQTHQTIASTYMNPYNSIHLQRVRVSVRCSDLCRTVANLFEISFFTLARQMLLSSAGLTFGRKLRREGKRHQKRLT
jgi:hypothetical protein